MTLISYKNNVLNVENVPVPFIADAVETPFYCYSATLLENVFLDFKNEIQKRHPDALICFAVKANANPAVLKTFADLGAGADIVSGGELKLALNAGIPPEKIVFSGVGKTKQELTDAVNAGICQINVESEEELIMIDAVARSLSKTADVALRINPDVDAHTHEKISTGKKENKFGISWESARALYQKAKEMKGVNPADIDVHIGSQLTETEPFDKAFQKVAEMLKTLIADGIEIRRVDLGGGLGIPYKDGENPPSFSQYADVVKKHFPEQNLTLIFEPGRCLCANAGILVSRVVRTKKTPAKTFLIVDAGMNDLIRPAMYDAYHKAVPVALNDNAEIEKYDIVGPVCESSDVFAKEHAMQACRPDELIAFLSAGAYGSAMSSNYNMHPLAAEVLVKGDQFAVVRKRQEIKNITELCSTAPWQE